jgi:CubicO group peptidase (beta-lactamase class C family)
MKNLISVIVFLSMGQVFAGPLLTLNTKTDLLDYIKAKKFNGILMVKEKRRTLFKEAFGVRDSQTKKRLSVHDKFLIGSNTKQMIAASLLQLEEEGKLSIDDLVSKYYPVPKSYENIRIKDILNHSAGIPNYTDIKEFWNLYGFDDHLSLDDILNFTLQYPLDFTPLSDWNYSNTGYILK